MSLRVRLLVAAAVALGVVQQAEACPVVCTKTVTNGSEVVEPSLVQYNVALTCPYAEDALLYLDDSLVGPLFDSNVPQNELPRVVAGSTLNYPYSVTLDYETCKSSPGAVLQPDGSVVVVNTVTGSTKLHRNEDGSAYVFTCSANVVCRPPDEEEGGATRTIGYYKTHAGAVDACLSSPIDLGFTVVSTVAEANAILWANPGSFRGVDKARATLARQVLGATCNTRLFDTDAGTLVSTAVAALAGTSCDAMGASNGAVDEFNNSGDDVAFPTGVGPFENTGKPATLAPFPTSGLACQ